MLLERDRELAAIDDLLRAAAGGHGGALVLEAPPGLGKSSLLASAAERADGFAVLRAGGHELESGLGWGVARSLFEPWLYADADRRDLLTGPAAPARALFEADAGTAGPAADVSFGILHGLYWLAVRISELGPLLLIVDDAHWADEPSLRFVHYLTARLAQHPILLLVASRTDVGLSGAAPHELAPLTEPAVAELVRRRVAAGDAFCHRCFELSRGNPLQVRELVTAIVQSGADDVDAVAEHAARSLSRSVLRRLEALSPDAQALARAVAVSGHEIAVHQATELAGIEVEAALAAADELAEADILARSEPLAFAHPLLRAAVYGALGRRDRAVFHRRAADVLAAHRAPWEQIGAHLLEAAPGGDAWVVDGLRRAAAEALAHGLPASAMTYLERALREPPADATRPDVLADLGRAALVAGRPDAATHIEHAIALLDDPVARARLRIDLARLMHDFGRLSEACAAIDTGLEELGDRDPEVALDLRSAYLTSAVMLPDRAADAHARVDAILAGADSATTRAERTLLTKAIIMRVYTGSSRERVATLARRLLAGGRLLEDDAIGSQAAGHVIITLSFCDEYAAAEEGLETAFQRVTRAGWVTWRAAMSVLRGRQSIWTGPIADAIEDGRTAVDTFAAGLQLYLPSAASVLVRALLEHDELEAAEEVRALLEERPAAVGPFMAWRHEVIGRIAAARGDHERALEAFLACGAAATRVLITNPGLFHWRSEAGLAALRLGRREQAAELIGEEVALAERFGAPRAVGVARRAAALLERGEDAVALLRSAAALHEGCGARVEHARTLAELGAAIRRTGAPGDARAVLREAIQLADETGARAVGRAAREELVRAGGRAPADDASPGDLTPSERRVAELAAAGRTNREIANELFVTVKAVEWHLGNVYRKLDVRGRGQLTAALGA